ncbi:hypothetical protein MNV_820010 [Candidatus Methanoperedens nitroreducens]|uniref:Uncharacterized protein n=1 Tax=Candidatus Methanoperedens nitratireducens TaxID=1392998 RepID=A0A284VTS9_9EURY|nr:hypothetical protein MNV_820010 [Candidatus Methanoperedens nitroreducens]
MNTLNAVFIIKLSVIIKDDTLFNGVREEGRLPVAEMLLRKVPSPSGPRTHSSA